MSDGVRVIFLGCDDYAAATSRWEDNGVGIQTNHTRKASPMTYMFDRTQYVAVAAGSNIIALAIQD